MSLWKPLPAPTTNVLARWCSVLSAPGGIASTLGALGGAQPPDHHHAALQPLPELPMSPWGASEGLSWVQASTGSVSLVSTDSIHQHQHAQPCLHGKACSPRLSLSSPSRFLHF